MEQGEPSDSFSNNQGGQSKGKDKQKQKQSSNRSKMSRLMEVEEAKMVSKNTINFLRYIDVSDFFMIFSIYTRWTCNDSDIHNKKIGLIH